jgi:hypothetical protein
MANGDRKYTPEVHATIIAFMRTGIGYPRAVLLAGLTYQTARTWRDAGMAEPDGPLGALVRDAAAVEADLTGQLERKVLDAALKGDDTKAAQWLLERRAPAEYSTRSTVDVVTHSPELTIPASISTAQLEAELEEMDQ